MRKFSQIWGVVCLLMLGVPVAGILFVRLTEPQRVEREHSEKAADEFLYLTETISFSKAPREMRLSAREACEDLDELEWLLENCYSYLHRKGVDYRGALDAVRASIGESILRSQLAWKISKVLALFGDGHTRVRDPRINWMCGEHLPFLIGQTEGRYYAFWEDRSGFVDPDCPCIVGIDGVRLEEWLAAAGQTAADGSEQFHEVLCVHNLRYYGILRRELGLERGKEISVQFASVDGILHKTVPVECADRRPKYGAWPEGGSRVLEGNIGYLRVGPMMDV